MCKDKRLQVTKQCDLKFAITSKFVDEVEFDVVPLDIHGIVSGILYLYDKKKSSIEEIMSITCLKNELST